MRDNMPGMNHKVPRCEPRPTAGHTGYFREWGWRSAWGGEGVGDSPESSAAVCACRARGVRRCRLLRRVLLVVLVAQPDTAAAASGAGAAMFLWLRGSSAVYPSPQTPSSPPPLISLPHRGAGVSQLRNLSWAPCCFRWQFKARL